jgi:hypothetical protein
MTLLGKILVFIDVLLSLMALTFAVAVYTNNVDWSDSPPKGEKPAGLLNQEKAALKDALAGLPPAQASWTVARGELLRKEEQAGQARDFYAAQLKLVRSDATADRPAQAVKFEGLQPVPDENNPALLKLEDAKDRAGKNLQSLSAHAASSADTQTKLMDVMTKYQADIEEDRKLTDEIVGEGTKKGLHQRLIDERVKRQGVQEEQNMVRPLLKNAEVDWGLIGKRKEGLDERIAELRNYLRKRHMVVVAAGKR